ncbi:MAG TPA: hypothetical protein VF008_15480 [Niastella sp.]
MQKKSYLLPVWFMLGMLLIVLLQGIPLFKLLARAPGLRTGKVLFVSLVLPVLFIIEASFYWGLRKRIFQKKRVWIHIGLTLFAVFLLKILMALIISTYSHFTSKGLFRSADLLSPLEMFIFWTCMIIGHIYFILVLVDSYSTRYDDVPDDIILNEVSS